MSYHRPFLLFSQSSAKLWLRAAMSGPGEIALGLSPRSTTHSLCDLGHDTQPLRASVSLSGQE